MDIESSIFAVSKDKGIQYMMDQLIEKFTFQLEEALEIASGIKAKAHHTQINKVYVAGLGGSGIGADFVLAMIRDECKIPFIVGKGYDIPAFVDQNTLAIASSYSGNTEETLHSFKQFLETGAKVMVISSGGVLIQLAKEHGFDYVQLPSSWPSPRACLGYSLVQQLAILQKLSIVKIDYLKSIRNSVELLNNEKKDIQSKAQKLASQLHNKIPVIYSSDSYEPVAVRFRQQINENAKALCWHHVIPEMNHNELVGWRDRLDNVAVVMLRNEDDFSRTALRMNIIEEIFSKLCPTVIKLNSKGNDRIERMLYTVHLVDWTSYYLAELRAVDSIEVDVIDYLKSELRKV